MENRLFSLSKIFTERLFRIPDYQRGYAWTEKQLREFWGDLLQLEVDKNHYIGVLTLEEVQENEYKKWDDDLWIVQSKSYIPYHVVDGQQRLTTAIILVQCIIESIKPNQKLNYTSAEAIKNRFIYETKDEGISRSYLFGYEKYNPSFEFLKTKVFLEKSDDSVLHETIYTSNLEFAKKFFKEKINELSFEELEILYKKLTQHFLFNIYTISNDIDVHVTFETMNNRGKPLSHLELLKNRLIYLSTKFPTDENEKTKLRRAVNESWKTIYHFLGKNKAKPLDDDTFLKIHFNVFFRKLIEPIVESHKLTFGDSLMQRQIARINNPIHQWYLLEKEFISKNIKEGKLTLKGTYDFINNLKDAVILWFDALNPQDSKFPVEEKKWLDKLNRLDFINFVVVAQAILTLYEKKYSKEVNTEFLKYIEIKMFVVEFFGHTVAKMKPILHTFARALDKFKTEKTLNSFLQLKINSVATQNFDFNELRSLWGRKNKGFYRWDGIKYFLFEYEMFLKEKSKTSRDKLNWDLICLEDADDYTTVEHIYPQTDTNEYWQKRFKQYTLIEKEKLKNSLGNLVPLSRPKNSSLQNISFDDKKNKGNGYVGFRFGSYSENEVAEYDEWTAKEILQRGIKLLEFMEVRWKLNFGTKTDKIYILNLEFVLKKEGLKIEEI